MIRLLLGLLIAANVVLFLWIQYGEATRKPDQPLQTSKPDFGEIRLVQEMQVSTPSESRQQDNSAPQAQMPTRPEASMVEPAIQAETEASDSEPRAPVPVQPPELYQDAVVETTPEVQEETQTETVARYCGELGPIRSRNMAEGYRRTFSGDESGAVKVEARQGKETVGYWAMIPAPPDVADAEETLKKLRAAGFTDLWLIRKGERKNAISLGLYTKERYAQRHANTIRDKGFDPVVVTKQKNTRVYWVVLSGIGEDKLQSIMEEKLPADAVLHKKDCKQALTGN